jgi:cytoskeletal protein RodZ
MAENPQINHAETKPIRTILPLLKKISYSAHVGHQRSQKYQLNMSKKYQNFTSVILVNLFQVLIIAGVCLALLYVSGNFQPTASSPTSNSQTSNSPTSNSEDNNSNDGSTAGNPPSDSGSSASLSEQVEQMILKDNHITSFIDLFQQDPSNWVGHIRVISDSTTGKVVIRTDYKYSNVERTDIRSYANYVFNLVKDQIPQLQTITVITSDNYYLESVGRK